MISGKKLNRIMSVLLSFVFVLTSVIVEPIPSVHAAEAAVISVTGDKTELKAGDTLNVTVSYTANGNSATGLEIQLDYDKSKLEVSSASKGSAVNISGLWDFNKNGDGFIVLSGTSGDEDVTVPDGTVFTATFTVKSDAEAGSVGLALSKRSVIDYNESDITTTVNNSLSSLSVVVSTTALTLSPATLTLAQGETGSVSLERTPATATDTVTYSTSDSAVATVGDDGTVTAVGPGSANITATSSNGVTSNACVVTVTLASTALSIDSAKTLAKGETAALTVTHTPENATDKAQVTWTSDNTAVATVDTSGVVTAVGPGSANIKAAIGSVESNACVVTVTVATTALTMSDTTLTLSKGGADGNLTVTVTPSDATDTDGIVWASSNTSVATVTGSGLSATVSPVGAGTANITATLNGKSATCAVTVKVPLTAITISADKTTIKKGQTAYLSVSYTPSDTTDAKTPINWTTSDSSIATVDSTGKVTAVADGTATITATAPAPNTSVKDTIDITVQENKITAISLNKTSGTIHRGKNETLTVTYTKQDATKDPTDDTTITWTSSDTSVATVDSTGKVTAVGKGSATITAALAARSELTATFDVTVDAPLEAIAITKDGRKVTTLTLLKGQEVNIATVLTPEDTDSTVNVTYISSNSSVASVGGTDGKITALSEGTTTITANSGVDDIKATLEVTVQEIHIDQITIDKVNPIIEKGDTVDLTATIGNAATTTDDKTITWTSSDPTIASVSPSTGNTVTVTASSTNGGTVTITATTSNGKTATSTVKVLRHIESMSVTSSASSVLKNSTVQISVVTTPAEHDDTITSTTFSIDNDASASISGEGVLTGIKAGTVNVTGKITLKDGTTMSDTVTVTVTENSVPTIAANLEMDPLLPATEIQLGNTLNIVPYIRIAGETRNFAKYRADNGYTDDVFYDCEIDDTGIATVDDLGNVTAKRVGSCTITVKVTTKDGSGNVTGVADKVVTGTITVVDNSANEVKSGDTTYVAAPALKLSDGAVPAADKTMILDQAQTDGTTIAEYYNIAEATAVKELSVTLTAEPPVSFTYTIDVPSDLPAIEGGKTRVFYIYRIHSYSGTPTLERLSTTRSGDKLSFVTDKFSTYAVGYIDTVTPVTLSATTGTPAATGTDGAAAGNDGWYLLADDGSGNGSDGYTRSPRTSENTSGTVVILMIAAAAALVGIMGSKRVRGK